MLAVTGTISMVFKLTGLNHVWWNSVVVMWMLQNASKLGSIFSSGAGVEFDFILYIENI